MLGVRLQRVGRGRTAQRDEDVQQWLYQVCLAAGSAETASAADDADGALADLCRPTGRRPAAGTGLRQATGQKCVLVRPGDGFQVCRVVTSASTTRTRSIRWPQTTTSGC